MGIKAIGITSQNREPGSEEERAFKQLTQNKVIDYNVFIATSWVDVGINFNNENISDIYCMFDNEYSRGDFTLLWQFMARARKSNPKFYITRPRLMPREKMLIRYVSDSLNMSFEEVLEELKVNYTTKKTSKSYSFLYDSLCKSANDAIEKDNNGIFTTKTTNTILGVYYESEYSKNPQFKPIPVRYFLHRMLEKISFDKEVIEENTNCTVIRSCNNANSYYESCSKQEIDNIKRYLTDLAFKQTEFILNDVIQKLKGLSGNHIKISDRLNPFIKNCGLDLKLINNRRSNDKRYYRLFFDFNFSEVCSYCDGYDISFTQIGYAKYTKESMEKIKAIQPGIEIINDKLNSNDEYFINISCIDGQINKKLYYCLNYLE